MDKINKIRIINMYPNTRIYERLGDPNTCEIDFSGKTICTITKSDDGLFYLDTSSFKGGLLSQEFLSTIVIFMEAANNGAYENYKKYLENKKANGDRSNIIPEEPPF